MRKNFCDHIHGIAAIDIVDAQESADAFDFNATQVLQFYQTSGIAWRHSRRPTLRIDSFDGVKRDDSSCDALSMASAKTIKCSQLRFQQNRFAGTYFIVLS